MLKVRIQNSRQYSNAVTVMLIENKIGKIPNIEHNGYKVYAKNTRLIAGSDFLDLGIKSDYYYYQDVHFESIKEKEEWTRNILICLEKIRSACITKIREKDNIPDVIQWGF